MQRQTKHNLTDEQNQQALAQRIEACVDFFVLPFTHPEDFFDLLMVNERLLVLNEEFRRIFYKSYYNDLNIELPKNWERLPLPIALIKEEKPKTKDEESIKPIFKNISNYNVVPISYLKRLVNNNLSFLEVTNLRLYKSYKEKILQLAVDKNPFYLSFFFRENPSVYQFFVNHMDELEQIAFNWYWESKSLNAKHKEEILRSWGKHKQSSKFIPEDKFKEIEEALRKVHTIFRIDRVQAYANFLFECEDYIDKKLSNYPDITRRILGIEIFHSFCMNTKKMEFTRFTQPVFKNYVERCLAECVHNFQVQCNNVKGNQSKSRIVFFKKNSSYKLLKKLLPMKQQKSERSEIKKLLKKENNQSLIILIEFIADQIKNKHQITKLNANEEPGRFLFHLFMAAKITLPEEQKQSVRLRFEEFVQGNNLQLLFNCSDAISLAVKTCQLENLMKPLTPSMVQISNNNNNNNRKR